MELSEDAYTRIIVETERAKAEAQAALSGLRELNTECDRRYGDIDRRLGQIIKLGIGILISLLGWSMAQLYAVNERAHEEPPAVSQPR